MRKPIIVALLAVIVATPTAAGPAEIIAAAAHSQGGGLWRFDVTVRHADEGWDHYADGWRVLSPSGDVLGERTLWHPHVNEQPFTRSLTGVAIPDDVTEVYLRPHDSVHGDGPDYGPIALEL